MIEINKLKDYANKLMFDMDDSEYETLQEEFEIINKQMDLIANIKDIEKVEAMTHPFLLESATMREDIEKDLITTDDALKNVKEKEKAFVKVPRVVG